MRQGLLLVGAFVGTLALLLGVYVLVLGGGTSGVAAVASPTPSASSSVAPSPSSRPSGVPSAAPTASIAASAGPSASWSPMPIMSEPVSTPVPAGSSDAATTITVPGALFTAYDTQAHSTISKLSNGSVVVTGTADDSNPTTLMWELPKSAIPAGSKIARLDTLICGSGEGNFWEVYGPDGSDPEEYEGAQPAADGCWHFTRAPGLDTSVHADIQLASSLRIDRVVYTVWLK